MSKAVNVRFIICQACSQLPITAEGMVSYRLCFRFIGTDVVLSVPVGGQDVSCHGELPRRNRKNYYSLIVDSSFFVCIFYVNTFYSVDI